MQHINQYMAERNQLMAIAPDKPETVAEFLARGGQSQTIAPGASGVHHPVRRNKRAHINFLKGLDRKRIASKSAELPPRQP